MVRGGEGACYICAGILLVLLLGIRQGAGQQPCTTYASSLYACYPYVEEGNRTAVGADCCTPLATIVKTRPDCLCTLQNLTSSVPNVNVTRAYQLASLCDIVSNATLSSCNGSPAPASTKKDSNGAFMLQRTSLFHVIFIGLTLCVYSFNQA